MGKFILKGQNKQMVQGNQPNRFNELQKLNDVNVGGVTDGQALAYQASTQKWIPTDNSLTYTERAEWGHTGFENRTDSTISYDYNTRTITVEPTATTFSYYLNGVKYDVGTGEISETHPDVSGYYYLYYDSTNTLQFSTTPFSILTDVPIAAVYYDASTPIGVAFEERHSYLRNKFAHYEFHNVVGSYWHTSDGGLAINDYTLQPVTPVDSDNQWSLTASEFHDEDIETVIPAISAGGPYTVAWRSGADGIWTWGSNNVPFLSSGTYIYYNQFTGGAWQETALDTNQYVNYYICHLHSVETGYRTVVIMGQDVHGNLADAQAEDITSITWGAFPADELISSYKITFRTNAAYGTEGKCRIAYVTDTRLSTNFQITAGTPSSNHNSLSGLQGGQAGEYYHLTAAQHTLVVNYDHGALNGLGDDDHTQYLLANGTRALTGDWDAGAHTIKSDGFLLDDSQNITWGGDESITFNGTDLVLISALNLNATLNSVEFGITSGTPTGKLTASGNGSLVFGDIEQSGEIKASGKGSIAYGNGVGSASASTIFATGIGSHAGGYISSGGDILASGNGSLASGATGSFGLTASGIGSFALGYADTGYILASANNAFQFGVGTNARINSAAFGGDLRLRFDGSTTSLRNGDIWSDSTDVFVRTGGNSVNLSTIGGDITAVGDVSSGAAFNGTQGTTLTFYNAGGNATQIYDGTDIAFNKGIEVTVANLYGQSAGIFTRTAGEYVYLCDSNEALYAVAPSGSVYAQLANDSFGGYFSDGTYSATLADVSNTVGGRFEDGTNTVDLAYGGVGAGIFSNGFDTVYIVDTVNGITVDTSSSGNPSFSSNNGIYTVSISSASEGINIYDGVANISLLQTGTVVGSFTDGSDLVYILDGSYGVQSDTSVSGNTAGYFVNGSYVVTLADGVSGYAGTFTEGVYNTYLAGGVGVQTTDGVNNVNLLDGLYGVNSTTNLIPAIYANDGTYTAILANISEAGYFYDASDYVKIIDGTYGINIDTSTSGNVPIVITEQADPLLSASAGIGRIWVKSSTPNELYFTDDAGTDWLLNQTASGGAVDTVGNSSSQVAVFDGSAGGGYILTFYNVGGNATLGYDGAKFDFNDGVTVTNGTDVAYLASGGEGVVTAESANYLVTLADSASASAAVFADDGVGGDRVYILDALNGININTSLSGVTGGYVNDGTYTVYLADSNGEFSEASAGLSVESVSQYVSIVDGTHGILIGNGSLAMIEIASAPADVAAVGQFWVKDDTPNTPYFTNDAGTDMELYRSGGTDVAIADGGTGASTAQAAIDVLTAVSGATNEHVLTKDTATGNAIFKAASIEGTAVKSTGEAGGIKFLREDGDGTCSWQTVSTGQSGWFGSTTRIKILPNQFVGTSQDKSAWLSLDGAYITDENDEIVANIPIPTGYKATHVMVYSNQNNNVTVYENDITDGTTATSKGTGNCNTEIDITDVTSSTTNYLSIFVQSTSDQTWGGYVTIAAV